LGKRGDAQNAAELARKLASTPLVDQSNLIRSSGPAMFVRMKALFPDLAPSSAEFSLSPSEPTNKPLGAADRPTNTMAQYALRNITLSSRWMYTGCQQQTLSSPMFKADASLLMDGEKLPTDPATLVAFAAARNGWLFPYKEDSEEVRTLAQLYSSTVARADGSIDSTLVPEGLKAICVTVVGAPQFWLGNPQPADALRRATLELGRRLPTFKEYSDILTKKRKVADIVKELQGTDDYFAVLREWHKNWLGFFPGVTDTSSGISLRPVYQLQGAFFDNQWAAIIKFRADEPIQGSFLDFSEGGYAYMPLAGFSCDHVKQDFDPRTTEIRWEQKNPVNGAWETIGSWKRDLDGSGNYLATWSKVPGQITGADGWMLTTGLEDVAYAYSVDYTAAIEPFEHKKGRLIGTPMERFKNYDRRVRRFAVSGEQNGMSVVRSPVTGTPVYACNSLDRYLASCAYRPNERDPNKITTDLWNEDWNATVPKIKMQYRFLRDTFMHPQVLDAMKCGPRDAAAMAKLSKADAYPLPYSDPAEHQAYPFGYSLADFKASVPASSLPIGDVASYASFDGYAYYYGTPKQDYQNYVDFENPAVQADLIARKDIHDEPFRFIEHLVRENRPYKELVTADYTWGSDYYEYLLRSQGYYLPVDAPGFKPRADMAAAKEPHQIFFNSFPDIPRQYLQSVTGSHSSDYSASNGDAYYFPDQLEANNIPHKNHSCILTMPAFTSQATPGLQQSVLKMRTMSARYFERLLCMSPAEVSLTQAQKDMQRNYIPLNEGGAKDHLDESKGCFGCHISLDPLAAALSPGFMTNIYAPSMGEIRLMDNLPYYRGDLYGIRGGGKPGKGAFLGEELEGVQAVGRKLASSREFHTCVARRAFENIYGRSPGLSDAKDFSRVVDRLMSSESYNQMILDIAGSPAFERGN
jgi:hypothetical protein